MAKSQFLIRNRHNNVWYGRVIIPGALRAHFNGKCEIRRSLKTADKRAAKKRALEFWVYCQTEFVRLVRKRGQGGEAMINIPAYIKTTDILGRLHEIDLDDPELEKEIAQYLHQDAAHLLQQYKDHPAVLEKLLQMNTPPAKAGGFRLRLKAGLIGHSADCCRYTT